jgi:hypothetical protein
MGLANRRAGVRVPLQMFLNEYIADDPYRCMSTNICPSGIYLNRLTRDYARPGGVVGLEFELPGTSEVIWARGEVRFDALDDYFHGTGVEFTGLAVKHQRLIEDYVTEAKLRRLRQLLDSVRRNRLH